ncbi:MAG TPA: transglutaminase-like domain-containing protein [Chthoniobacterales bacterium]|jgi:regulator of sirC expression with transglutaminase-like and TPR domain|nr:transglutaminase-like domain-containing protein [Chthoniobacterales bacterium]
MFKQREAIIRLLKDSDPDTVSLTKRQLVQGGPRTIPDLRDLLTAEDHQVTGHVREILTEIESTYAREALEGICGKISTLTDLENASWYVAQIFLPGLELEPYQSKIDSWGRELRQRLGSCDSDESRVVAMSQFVGKELGLHGNESDYYNARNSFLPCVIDTRLGIPISLSLVYMMVARRADCIVEGINLPGHFVVRHGTLLFDPFHEGRILTTEECARGLGPVIPREIRKLTQDHFQSAHPKLILYRMLANLLYIFQHEQHGESYKMILQWIRLLEPK